MTLLPIAARELRVASRKRGTFRLRTAAAALGIVIGAGALVLHTFQGTAGRGPGSAVFYILTWLAFAAALVSGVFYSSDIISEEKREGTLGLLFLTDLRGFDVVTGKLMVAGLRLFSALIGLFPVLAVALLFGQITGAQLTKTWLALANVMFCSLAGGAFISSVSRDGQRAMLGAGLFIFFISIAGPLVDAVLTKVYRPQFFPVGSVTSAPYAFIVAGDWTGRSAFWRALLISHVVGWVWLLLASFFIARSWQERPARAGARLWSRLSYRWRYGGPSRRLRLRRAMLDRNPVYWLASRERWQGIGAWLILAVYTVAAVTILLAGFPASVLMVTFSASSLFLIVCYVLIASQAPRFFLEARRSGLVELLLAAPLRSEDILKGQWHALRRFFAWPVGLLLVAQAVLAGCVFLRQGSQPGWPITGLWTVTSMVGTVLVGGCNVVAIASFGMWMGLTSRSVNTATLKTLLFVQVIPWFIIQFISGIVMVSLIVPTLSRAAGGAVLAQSGMPFAVLALPAVLALLKDAGFIWFSQRNLRTRIREVASRQAKGSPFAAALPAPAPIPVPPVIPSSKPPQS